MKAFRVKGTFRDERAGRQPYSIEIAAEDIDSAKEQTVSTLGSRHKLKRRDIDIDDVSEIAAADVVDHVVKYKIGE